jgi:hypothetical protein
MRLLSGRQEKNVLLYCNYYKAQRNWSAVLGCSNAGEDAQRCAIVTA